MQNSNQYYYYYGQDGQCYYYNPTDGQYYPYYGNSSFDFASGSGQYDYYNYQSVPSVDNPATTATEPEEPQTSTSSGKKKKRLADRVDLTKKRINAPIRSAAGEIWQDPTLKEWDPSDFRLFVGNLGPEVSDSILKQSFEKYKSFQKARVICDKRTQKSRGYGFVSFKEAQDFTDAFRDMNGKYIGARPCKLQKSNWQDRNVSANQAKKIMKHGYLQILTEQLKKQPQHLPSSSSSTSKIQSSNEKNKKP